MTGDEILKALYLRTPALSVCSDAMGAARDLLVKCYRGGGKVLACGNGGSAADADHLVGELMKGFRRARPLPEALRLRFRAEGGKDGSFLASSLQEALPAISLNVHHSLLSASANDQTWDVALAQQVLGYGKPGDVLVCFSTSGKSRNIVYAARTARLLGLKVAGFTGSDGGPLAPLCDVAVRVPEASTFLVQEMHLPAYHALAAAVEADFFTE